MKYGLLIILMETSTSTGKRVNSLMEENPDIKEELKNFHNILLSQLKHLLNLRTS